MDKSGTRVMVVTGSSGGHIFPAVALVETLAASGRAEVMLVLPREHSAGGLKQGAFRIRHISIVPLKRCRGIGCAAAFLGIAKGIFESFFLLAEFRPRVVVGFGSIYSVPLVFFAWMFRMKTLIHEQNVTPGAANRFLMRFADGLAVSFPQTLRLCGALPARSVLTGNPVRSSLRRVGREEARRTLGLDPGAFTVLVMGGSQGSRSVNDGFIAALAGLPEDKRPQVIHISGPADCARVQDAYRSLALKAKVFSFLDTMEYAYSAADLAVSRSGATSIAEIAHFAVPAILVPYPHARMHQRENAAAFQVETGCLVIQDEQLKSGLLGSFLSAFLEHPERVAAMRSQYGSGRGSAAERLSDLTLSFAAERPLS